MPMPDTNPRVLLVNDDGIDGPGLVMLERIVGAFTDDIWVVAPDEERSGAGHSFATTLPIRVRQRDERHFAVKGTPTDCALLAIHDLIPDKKPDILISGINRGPNLAEDITYSGTAAAAMEGALLGIPAIALSQYFQPPAPVHWDTAEAYAGRVIERLLRIDWQPGLFVNVNFPGCPADEVRGIRVTTQGQRPPGAFLPERRVDARHFPYYWIRIAMPDGGHAPGNDLQAMRDREVSITPMQLDMTCRPAMANLNAVFADG
jgi:5'-nucleotidase